MKCDNKSFKNSYCDGVEQMSHSSSVWTEFDLNNKKIVKNVKILFKKNKHLKPFSEKRNKKINIKHILKKLQMTALKNINKM